MNAVSKLDCRAHGPAEKINKCVHRDFNSAVLFRFRDSGRCVLLNLIASVLTVEQKRGRQLCETHTRGNRKLCFFCTDDLFCLFVKSHN